MGAFVGLQPTDTGALAALLDKSADELAEAAFLADVYLYRSDLSSPGAAALHRVAPEVARVAIELRKRVALATAFSIAPELQTALLRAAAAAAPVAVGTCSVGPTTVVGSFTPCDPAERVEIFTLDAHAEIALALGVKLNASHAYRIEYLRSGKLRITVIESAAAGVVVGKGSDGSIAVGGLALAGGTSIGASSQLLYAQGDTYLVDADELEPFIVADVLHHLQPFAVPFAPSAGSVIKRIGGRVASAFDEVPLGPGSRLIDHAKKDLNWKRPAAVSHFIEGGVRIDAGGSAGGSIGKGEVSVDVRGVVGLERQAEVETIYLDIQGSAAASIGLQLFGKELASAVFAQLRLGLVRERETGEFNRIEITQLTDVDGAVVRHTAVLELGDPEARRQAQRLIDSLQPPGNLEQALDAVRRIAAERVTVDRTMIDNVASTTVALSILGNGLTFNVERFKVR